MKTSLILTASGLTCWLLLEIMPWRWTWMARFLLLLLCLWALTEVLWLGHLIWSYIKQMAFFRLGKPRNPEQSDVAV